VAGSEWEGPQGDGRVGEPEGRGDGSEEREGQDELGEEVDQAHPVNRCNHSTHYSASLRCVRGLQPWPWWSLSSGGAIHVTVSRRTQIRAWGERDSLSERTRTRASSLYLWLRKKRS